MEIGTFLPRKKGVVVQGGSIVGLGDQVWVNVWIRVGTSGFFSKKKGIVVSFRKIGLTQCLLSKAILDKGTIQVEVMILETEKNNFFSPSDVWGDERKANGCRIANNKYVMRGEIVWMWRNRANYPALVCKIVQGWSGHGQFIDCAYPDTQRSYPSHANEVYASEQEALDADPERANALVHCWMRAGIRQGVTLKELVPA